ncbi:metallophosphoesterase [Marinospirillum sp. MEB164]|uniref:Metallophosphoesterase n=1 Tax=Marinospirillum alkalitolerans TaxID=3123374 RepID=A0ABW8PU90_9GAMM
MSTTRLRIAQLSDLHLTASDQGLYRGRSSRQALCLALDQACAGGADRLLLSGDLAQDVEPATYAWLVVQLEKTGRPWHWLPGNHDAPEMMQSWAATEWEAIWAGWQVIGLSTHQPHSAAGRLNASSLARLKQASAQNQPLLIALHHPPLLADRPWLNSIGLENAADFWTALQDRTAPCVILAGHWHQALEQSRREAQCWVAPSTVMQFSSTSQEFALAPEVGGGLRWVDITAQGQIQTQIRHWPLESSRLMCSK